MPVVPSFRMTRGACQKSSGGRVEDVVARGRTRNCGEHALGARKSDAAGRWARRGWRADPKLRRLAPLYEDSAVGIERYGNRLLGGRREEHSVARLLIRSAVRPWL